jgi:hypothetical protein
MSELPILCRGPRPGVEKPIDCLVGFGVVFRTEADKLALLLASPSCFAVIPTYLLALDPAVILGPALTAVLAPSMVFCTSPSIRRVTTLGRGPGVLTDGREAEGVARPDGVARPCSEKEAWDDASERCDATDTGREIPAVGADNLLARTNMPRSGAQEKY